MGAHATRKIPWSVISTAKSRALWVLIICILAVWNLSFTSYHDETSEFNKSLLISQQQNYHTCQLPKTKERLTLPILPHFMIIGAQKAGTTVLSELLQLVPGITRHEKKEAHFFDYEIPRRYDARKLSRDPQLCCDYYHQYLSYYGQTAASWGGGRFFSTSSPTMYYFEKTPSYLARPDIPEKLQYILPNLPKVLIVLRDPIERAYSHYAMSWQLAMKRKEPFPCFDELVADEIQTLLKKDWIQAPPYIIFNGTDNSNHHVPDDFFFIPLKSQIRGRRRIAHYEGMIHRGCYSEQIKHWLDVFPKNSIMVLHYEGFVENKTGVMQDVLNFLDVDPTFTFPPSKLEKDYSPNKPIVPQQSLECTLLKKETKAYLKKFYKPYNDELANLLGSYWEGVWDDSDEERTP